jgi:hypothetical protein
MDRDLLVITLLNDPIQLILQGLEFFKMNIFQTKELGLERFDFCLVLFLIVLENKLETVVLTFTLRIAC